MVQYDPTVIQTNAQRLYKKAGMIVVTATLCGALLGGIGGFFLMATVDGVFKWVVLGAPLLLLGALGYAIGSARAFVLRLMAQTSLCQVQIEINTRRGSLASSN